MFFFSLCASSHHLFITDVHGNKERKGLERKRTQTRDPSSGYNHLYANTWVLSVCPLHPWSEGEGCVCVRERGEAGGTGVQRASRVIWRTGERQGAASITAGR